jgi:hypothetical protein
MGRCGYCVDLACLLLSDSPGYTEWAWFNILYFQWSSEQEAPLGDLCSVERLPVIPLQCTCNILRCGITLKGSGPGYGAVRGVVAVGRLSLVPSSCSGHA